MNSGDFSFEFAYEASVPPGTEEILRRVARFCLAAEGVLRPCAAYLLFTNDAGIQKINREQRNIDRSTDVLSFPSAAFTPSHTAGQAPRLLQREWDATLGACYLGDIVISMEHVDAQAREYGHSFTRELCYLTVHALFHLMGYDHMTSEDREEMRKMEDKALSAAGIARVSDETLLENARKALLNAYAPYSKYRVGACLLAADGRMFTGCNIENASYGDTICAERTALFKAVSEGAREFSVLAIAAEKSLPWPCGLCRQALFEFAPTLRILVCCGEERAESTLDCLLPNGFGPSSGTGAYLGKDENE